MRVKIPPFAKGGLEGISGGIGVSPVLPAALVGRVSPPARHLNFASRLEKLGKIAILISDQLPCAYLRQIDDIRKPAPFSMGTRIRHTPIIKGKMSYAVAIFALKLAIVKLMNLPPDVLGLKLY